jgi:hypothetical protein
MGKINKVVSFQNLSSELLELLHKKYPDGYQNHVIKVTTPKNDFFYGVTLDTADVSYLIKVPVKVDSNPDEIEDKDFVGDSDDVITPDETFNDAEDAEDPDSIPEDD